MRLLEKLLIITDGPKPSNDEVPMKIILLLSLVSFSSLTFSSENLSQADVIKAIESSLDKKDLECAWTSDKTDIFLASNLDHESLQEFSMSINEANPSIITFARVDEKEETVVVVTTNSELTVVKSITSVASAVKKTHKNVGTIIKPKFEEVIDRTEIETLICR